MSRSSTAARTLTLGICATLVVGAVAAPGASAADKPLAQSVGRFLDGSVGGKPIQSLADVHDARAVNPGTTSAQNPLDATLLGQLELPLSGALQLPGGGVFTLGAVNQVAQAKSDGYSYGASGAVSNSGGISLGGSTDFPANATIDLSAASLGSVTIPTVPGLPVSAAGTPSASTTAAALGGVSATIGAVSALAQTKTGGDAVTPQYQIAGLTLTLGSPALGALLEQLSKGKATLDGLIQQITSALQLLGAVPGINQALQDCSLTATDLPATIKLDGGAVIIDPLHATVTIDLAKLLEAAHLDLNELPANTDLVAYLLGHLGDILSQGLEGVINGIVNPLKDLGDKCLGLLPTNIRTLLGTLFSTLTTGQQDLEDAVDKVAAALSSAGAPGLKTLTDNLAKVVAIGVNVESGPGKAADNKDYKFTSALDATPDQATAVVPDQTLVRAIEIDLLDGQGAVLALGNAAAGPSSPAVAPPTSSTPAPPTTTVPGSAIPTGVPAGLANTDTGTPTLPIVLLILGLLMAAGGALTWRLRGGRHLG